ncbi:MAG: phosphohistidine phosphatase SixA [Gemmatimonadales bacterium]|nr:phosphohistidine phosphatase SixA [Gemmatimonadales bacterium]NIN13036.1 phosphohistidine phosphatase SixA [Gemmatimonadales bacterium]NIN51120.1 phosphohistidine phosphatase SixA [Gemmatimonadales bacterium]NIP08584.1 phosphohistidine phosphatase SixA [Gemmatimonadales bacterium]NIQ99694.1 phosphohistidine phosphatase SixA [Gemmatimonadales bacterium]
MELYLVQHGKATSKEEDPARPLTAEGRDEVTRVARAAGAQEVTVGSIHHSGKLRAQQTAEILAGELHPDQAPDQLDGLAPNDEPTTAADVIPTLKAPAMLVGHLPHLSRLCSLLVHGDPTREIVAFRMGAIVCLSLDTEGRWRVRWILTPEVAPPAS